MDRMKRAPSRVTILAYLQFISSYPIQASEMQWALKPPFNLEKLAVEQYIGILESYLSLSLSLTNDQFSW